MNSIEKNQKSRAFHTGLAVAAATVAVPLLAALVLPVELAFPLCLVAPFVGMTSLEALLAHGRLLGRHRHA